MKKTLLFAIVACIPFAACVPSNSSKVPLADSTALKSSRSIAPRSLPNWTGPYSQFIPIDTANKMLSSYLNSINYQHNDSDLHSIMFDANQVRTLLADKRITNIKIMFAHSLAYINAGGGNTNCGYHAKELTVIISGYDSSGNYTYHPQNTVLEIGSPCPPNCRVTGTASQDLLPPGDTAHGIN